MALPSNINEVFRYKKALPLAKKAGGHLQSFASKNANPTNKLAIFNFKAWNNIHFCYAYQSCKTPVNNAL
jgi:hypothetical protein